LVQDFEQQSSPLAHAAPFAAHIVVVATQDPFVH
jgi:hypothetical protein